MRLGYFTMPVHPMHRKWVDTLREDREAIILADRLGFYDAFVGEHLTDRCENVTNSMIFLATLIPETKRIKLATGTANLSHKHPVLTAVQAAMFDHLAQGRFILGVSPGALTSDAEALGILDEDRNKMFAEAIDVILAIWERDPPYDIDFPDNRYKVAIRRTAALHIGVGYMGKPYQQPHRRSWARWSRLSRPASCRWASATFILSPRTSCFPSTSSPIGRITARASSRSAPSRECPNGEWLARFSYTTTTKWRSVTAALTRRALTPSTTLRCSRR
jgi:hypothetical protein